MKSEVNSITEQVSISSLLTQEDKEQTIREIFTGLSSDRKYISSRFFYDAEGSALFEKITTLPEYYPTRTEKAILENISSEIIGEGGHIDIVELGSGDCSKISILLDAIPPGMMSSVKYYPVDISESSIIKSSESLSNKYPGLQINGLLADFMNHLDGLPGEDKRLVCFFGSTIGNLTREQSIEFLTGIREMMHGGDSLLVGFDMVKARDILETAYNDSQGITEAFNKNILKAVNNIAGTHFQPELFRHLAFYDPAKMRIEMHLEALADMEIHSPDFRHDIHISKGETILTENSHKFTGELIYEMAENAGFKVRNIYTDKKGWFSLVQFLPFD
ncbi:MAG: L-histidine N(alpha)-methyltransferase [Bacteroidales bacterium]|nr:L-histidine N(alpha)-methyltransferase [Bacteroidales bacterium]